VAADVEDCVEVGGLADEVVELLRRLPDRRRVLVEGDGDVVLCGVDGGRVERCFAAGGGRDGDLGLGGEDVIGVRELCDTMVSMSGLSLFDRRGSGAYRAGTSRWACPCCRACCGR
jgi:hypothetical protein